MSLLKEYAVEPACLGIDARTATQVLDLFGSDRGRVIAGNPRAWLEEAARALDRWAAGRSHPLKRTRVVERLRIMAATGLFPERVDWLDELPWSEAALHEHQVRPFSAVLSTEVRNADNWIAVPDNLDPTDPSLESGHEIRVPRTAEAMANALAPLLQASKVVLFVDPYFSPEQDRFRRTLEAFVGLVNRPARFEYHLRGARHNGPERPTAEVFRDRLSEHCRFLPQGLRLSFLRWRERPEGEHFHARYIVTNRGTVRIDNGLDEGRPGQTVPLTLLPYHEHQRWFRTFGETSNVFDLLPPIFDLSIDGRVEQREGAYP